MNHVVILSVCFYYMPQTQLNIFDNDKTVSRITYTALVETLNPA